MCSSPWLIAAYHVLHRLLMPRHSPCALLSLTSLFAPSSFSGSQNYASSIRKFHWLNCILPNFVPYCCFFIFSSFLPCSVFKVQLSLFSDVSIRNPLMKASLLKKLSSTDSFALAVFRWWAQVDSNHRPHDYQSCALTS